MQTGIHPLYSTFKNVFKMKLEIDKEIALTNDTLDSHNIDKALYI